VPAVPVASITDGGAGEPSTAVRARVNAARLVQQQRYGTTGPRTNGDLRGRAVAQACRPDGPGRDLLRRAVERMGLSARGYDRVLKVARTIADLGGVERVAAGHVGEALQYRMVE
jgi:magnesium chelatase family protein